MGENSEPADGAVTSTKVDDHAWEREHRHPTAEQARSIGHRRRDAEAKLEQHLREARDKSETESGGQQEQL
jgi:hypothetical protein